MADHADHAARAVRFLGRQAQFGAVSAALALSVVTLATARDQGLGGPGWSPITPQPARMAAAAATAQAQPASVERILDRCQAAMDAADGVTYVADVWTESGGGRAARMRDLNVVVGSPADSRSPILVRPFRVLGRYAALPGASTDTALATGEAIRIGFDGTTVRTLRPSVRRLDERNPWDAMPEAFAALLPGWVQRGDLELRPGDRATLGAAEQIDGVPCRAVAIERAAGRGVRISDRIWFADVDGLPRRFERESVINGLNGGQPLRTVVAARDMKIQRASDMAQFVVALPAGWNRSGPAMRTTATPVAPAVEPRVTRPAPTRRATATETTRPRPATETTRRATATEITRPAAVDETTRPATATETTRPAVERPIKPATGTPPKPAEPVNPDGPIKVTDAETPSRPIEARPPDGPLADGTPGPAFELLTPDGKTVSLKSLRGRVVVLDFWATWCGPCKLAMPGLQQLQDQLGDRGLTVIGMNQRENGDPAAYMAEKKLNYTLLLDADAAARAYGVRGMPHVVILDRKGTIRFTQVGYAPGHVRSLRLVAEGLLGETPADG
ncbi:MAG: redoxin family protein [Phycisphaerales bacterium]